MKLYTFQIPENAAPGRLLALAGRMLPDVPEYLLREAFKKRDVKIDGQRCGMDAMIVPGAQVQIYARESASKAIDIPVVFEDENVLIAVKPAGVSCEKDGKGGKTLPELLQKEGLPKPLLCHRLDNPTEGLILLAKTAAVQQALQDAFRMHKVHKTYTCIVKGTPVPPVATLCHYLFKDAQNARVRVAEHAGHGAKKIITEYRVMNAGECARVSVDLHTGRTHQIRAHMAYIGHPLLGDDQYGDRAFNKLHKARKLMLCATRLRFELDGDLAYLNERDFHCRPSF